MSELLKMYLRCNKRIESETIRLTKDSFRRLIDLYGDIDARDLSYGHCEEFQAWSLNSGRSPTTANIYVKTLRPVFRWAVKRDLIDSDPWEDLKLLKVPKKLIRILEKDEFEKLLSYAPSKIWRARLLLAKTAGLRRGEVLNLTLNDVDFDRGIVYVQPKRETKFTWRWQVKDKDTREVPLVKEVAKLLIYIQTQLPDRQPYLLIKPERYCKVIELKEAGKLIDRIRRNPDNNFERSMRLMFRKAEVKNATFHDLRRTCITEWLENGLHPHEVMKLAGHSDISTTLNYYVATRRNLVHRAKQASEAALGPNLDALLTRATIFDDFQPSEGSSDAT